jgi:hypothetical protein
MHQYNLIRYLIRFANDEIKAGKLLPEEKKVVLGYWLRINGIRKEEK